MVKRDVRITWREQQEAGSNTTLRDLAVERGIDPNKPYGVWRDAMSRDLVVTQEVPDGSGG